jgi:Mrp family chromosome partitioning ATPase
VLEGMLPSSARTIAVVVSGGNVDRAAFATALARG